MFGDLAAWRNVGALIYRVSAGMRQIVIALTIPGPQNPAALKHRWVVVVLALVAASAFALSVQAGRWWAVGDVEIGPFGAHSPYGNSGSLSWAGGSPRWARFGAATWAGGLIAMFVLVVVAGAVAARRIPKLAAKTALVAIATAALAAIAFIAARPDNGLPFVLGRGVVLFAVALVTGLLAVVPVLRARAHPVA